MHKIPFQCALVGLTVLKKRTLIQIKLVKESFKGSNFV